MNAIYNHINTNITNANKSQKRQNNKNFISYLDNKENIYLSEKQRNLTKFNSQKKIKRKESFSNNKNNINKNALIYALNGNNINIKLKNISNLITKNSKSTKNNNSHKTPNLSKPKLEIEINNNNSNNLSSHYSRKTNNKRYKKNISEHDLVNNILNTFTNYNLQKGNNIKLNCSNKKKCSYDKNIIKKNKFTESQKVNKNKTRHASDTKLLRSSSGFSYINNQLAQTNSFFNGNNINQFNQLGYISTWGNNPDLSNNHFADIITNQKKNNNKEMNKNNKGPIIGKIIKNYKNNDLNCIFNMNLIQPTSQINNIQDYLKNLYKIEYSSEHGNKRKKNNNKKESLFNEDKEKEEKIKINNDEYSNNSKYTVTKTSEISRNKKSNKFCNDSPEEIHFYVISSIQNAKNMDTNLNKK